MGKKWYPSLYWLQFDLFRSGEHPICQQIRMLTQRKTTPCLPSWHRQHWCCHSQSWGAAAIGTSATSWIIFALAMYENIWTYIWTYMDAIYHNCDIDIFGPHLDCACFGPFRQTVYVPWVDKLWTSSSYKIWKPSNKPPNSLKNPTLQQTRGQIRPDQPNSGAPGSFVQRPSVTGISPASQTLRLRTPCTRPCGSPHQLRCEMCWSYAFINLQQIQIVIKCYQSYELDQNTNIQ